MTRSELLERALALQAWLDGVTVDVPWPPPLRAVIDQCREDLAVAIAAVDAGELLDGIEITNFEALRGLLQKH